MTDSEIFQMISDIQIRSKRIKGALLKLIDLLEMMVLDQRKAQTLLSSPDGRHGFALKSKRKIP